mgnify:CR=1 FL=1
MINNIIEFAVQQRFLVMLALAGLCGWGAISYQQIPIDAFPDVTNNQVQILTPAGGYSPIEVEKFVTYPIELEMSSIPGLIENRSISQFGLSAITLVFEDGIDIYWARQQVLERLIRVKGDLPEDIEPEIGPVSTGLGEIYQYALESDSLSPMEIREIQDWIIAPVLRGVKGVIEVNSLGGFVKQYHITVNPDLVQKFAVTLDEIWEAVAANNENTGGNYIIRDAEQFVVRGIGLIETVSDIKNIVIKERQGVPVLVKDVATVEIQPQVRYGAATKDAEGEAVIGIIMMLKGESGRDVVLRVKEMLNRLKPSLPAELSIVPYYDRIELVNKAIATVTNALFIGGILVIVVLIIFLGNFRSSLIVALVLPIAILLSFIVMKLVGLSSNLMSLGGLAIGIGMMVDGGIVVVENINRQLKENKIPNKVSLLVVVTKAAKEVGRPSFFAVLIVVTVFLPLFTLQGLEGKMFSPLAVTISIALFAALILAITMAPALSALILRKPKKKRTKRSGSTFTHKIYTPVLEFCLKHRRGVLIGAAVLTIAGIFLFSYLGTEFVPALEEGAIAIQAFRLPSVSTENSVKINRIIEKKIMQTPEITTVVSRIGRAEVATDPMLPSISDIYVMMKPLAEWREGFSKEKIVEEMREDLETIPGVLFSFSQPIALRVDELISGVKSQLAIKIFGEDMTIMKSLAEQITAILKPMGGARDVKVEQTSGFGYLQIKINRNTLSRYGMSVKEINEYIRIAIGGGTVSTLIEGEKRFDIVIRFEENYRNNLEAISNILVTTPNRQQLPLTTFADISFAEGPAQVSREDGKRKITVELNISGIDIGTFVSKAQAAITQSVNLPTGYFLKWGGQFENQQRANRRLMIILPITLILIFILLFMMFRSLKQSSLILLNLPFSLIGGALSLWIMGLYLSVPASVGFIAVIGTAVQNGIVMVSFIHEQRKEKPSLPESIKHGAALRVRPILMTSFTTILGLIPLLLTTGVGSEIQRPLAAVVIGGLITSTISTLFLLPLLYGLFEEKL